MASHYGGAELEGAHVATTTNLYTFHEEFALISP